MIATDEDALVCDMAETYGVLKMRELPIPLLATLACGLGDESRIKMALSGQKVKQDTLLLATCADMLSFIAWTKTEGAKHNSNRPKSIVNILLGTEEQSEARAYRTPEDFEREWKKLGGNHGN